MADHYNTHCIAVQGNLWEWMKMQCRYLGWKVYDYYQNINIWLLSSICLHEIAVSTTWKPHNWEVYLINHLWDRDNHSTKDRNPAPSVSVIQRFHCSWLRNWIFDPKRWCNLHFYSSAFLCSSRWIPQFFIIVYPPPILIAFVLESVLGLYMSSKLRLSIQGYSFNHR